MIVPNYMPPIFLVPRPHPFTHTHSPPTHPHAQAEIRKKIKRCKTDSGFDSIEWGNPERPEATNLLNIYQV